MAFTRHGYHIPGSPNDTVTTRTVDIDCEGLFLGLIGLGFFVFIRALFEGRVGFA
jgi:hypothetical protein